MAMFSHRLRRALPTATSYFNRSIYLSQVSIAPPADFVSVSSVIRRSVLGCSTEATRAPVRLFSTRQYKLYKEGDEITEDTVLFEGCDYNHWLITMDFPKDNPLSPEEMVSTYEQTCANGLGISLEEAKKKIYACSTTTYNGFQAIMTEQESERFKDLPGVVFILPDSYIDPLNKEYGGDKYENGVITHRPPPIHNSRARPRDRSNSRFGGSPQNFQRNTQYGQQPPMHGGRASYGTPGQGTQAPPPVQGGYSQGSGSLPPSFQGGYNQGQGSPPPPYQGGYNQGQGSPPPPYQGGYNQHQGTPVPPYQGTQGSYNQGGSQGPQGGYNQGGPRNYSPQGNGNYSPAQGAVNPGYGQAYSGAGQEQNQRNAAGDWNNNNPAGQSGSDQFPQGRRY